MSRVRNGHLHPLYRGVYAVGHANLTREGALPGRRQGLRAQRRPQPLLGRRPLRARPLGRPLPRGDRGRHDASEGIAASARTARPSLDATHHQGIPVTTPARTLIDLAATLDYQPLRRAVREAQRQLVTIPQILAHARPPRPPPRHRQPHQDPRHRPRPNPKRTRGRRPRSPPQCGVRTAARQRADQPRRPHHHPRLPLARPTPGHRGRRRRTGTTTASPAKTTPRSRPSSKPTANASSASPGPKPSPTAPRRSTRIRAAGAPT